MDVDTTFYRNDNTEITRENGLLVSSTRTLTTPDGTPLASQTGNTGDTQPATNAEADWTWLMADYQNSTRLAVTHNPTSGGAVSRVHYYPFGDATTSGPPETPTGRGYLGKTHDVVGDIRLDHRNYTPHLNQLTTPDPVFDPTDPRSFNPYTYANDNPMAEGDPSGQWSCEEVDGRCFGPNADSTNYVPTPPKQPSGPLSIDEVPQAIREQMFEPGYIRIAPNGPGIAADYRPYDSIDPDEDDIRLAARIKALAGLGRIYLALKGYNDAANMLGHWLGNTGQDYKLDVGRFVDDLPQFRGEIDVQLGLLGNRRHFDTGWQSTTTGNSNGNWYFAVNNFRYRLVGGSRGSVSWAWVQVYKRYNFGANPGEKERRILHIPSSAWPHVSIDQEQWRKLNTYGWAQDYDVVGSELYVWRQ